MGYQGVHSAGNYNTHEIAPDFDDFRCIRLEYLKLSAKN